MLSATQLEILLSEHDLDPQDAQNIYAWMEQHADSYDSADDLAFDAYDNFPAEAEEYDPEAFIAIANLLEVNSM